MMLFYCKVEIVENVTLKLVETALKCLIIGWSMFYFVLETMGRKKFNCLKFVKTIISFMSTFL